MDFCLSFFYLWFGGVYHYHALFFSFLEPKKKSSLPPFPPPWLSGSGKFIGWTDLMGLVGLVWWNFRLIIRCGLDGGLMFFFLFIPETFLLSYLVFFYVSYLQDFSFHFPISTVSFRCPECWCGFRFVSVSGPLSSSLLSISLYNLSSLSHHIPNLAAFIPL